MVPVLLNSLSVTADGKSLVFLKWANHMTSYVAELGKNNTRIDNPRHFPLTAGSDGTVEWAARQQRCFLRFESPRQVRNL